MDRNLEKDEKNIRFKGRERNGSRKFPYFQKLKSNKLKSSFDLFVFVQRDEKITLKQKLL